ncbi:MAG TPA: tRNA lysidine(34) synthetase TilS, partial [Gemmatimonadaceae bacterium]|nr:tRNA lysidine(34) synthetase TilS [Gemmatimonadaceae bacterium]
VEQYVRDCGLVWIDDPTNRSRVFFRNRLRLDLLPAIRRVQPNLENELIALSAGAARIREALDEVARGLIRTGAPPPGRAPAVDAATLEALDDASLRVLWPAIAARMGVVLDRRGTERLARFTPRARIGARMQLSGGFEVLRERSVFTLRPCEIPAPAVGDVPLRDALRFGRFRFEVVRGASTDPGPADPAARPADPWVASFPDSHEFKVTVRAWRPGDRIDAPGSRLAGAAQDRRRVKRLFADARIAGPLREGWPVVLLNERIVWVPGVRRAPDATVRAGGASIVYRCHAD